jgi:hypothetical protein
MSKISVTVNSETILNTFDDIKMNKDVRTLIKDMFLHNDKASTMLGKILLGEELPKKPAIGQMGYIAINNWFTNKEFTKDSDLDIKGYVSCKVVELRGYADWGPIQVELPTYNKLGDIEIITTGTDYTEFIWLEEDIKDSI